MTTFTANSSWQEWVDFCREVDSTREGFDPVEENCSLVIWARGLGDITLAEAIRGPCQDWQGSRAWTWAVTIAWDQVPQALKAEVLAVIGIEPPMAALTYERMTNHLTEPEKRILWDAFAPAMSVMREKLAREIGEPQDG
ncbi:MAG: hypothetical protein KF810_03000 [Rhizobiaceae bacterium]|nr:hypothetical protein [Rhizobiaceae bacterium]